MGSCNIDRGRELVVMYLCPPYVSRKVLLLILILRHLKGFALDGGFARVRDCR